MAHLNSLRPITYRLNSTPVNELPRFAGYLAQAISNCTELIQGSESQKSDTSVQIQKLISRTTALLQDKTQEGRFTGVVLVKALAEVCGNQNLASYGSAWVRGLLSCLSRQDPPQIKKLAVLTITRIYLLTSGNQTMTREITTPTLPAFLTACLGIIKPTVVSKDGVELQLPSPILQSVLQSWIQLIQTFRSTFRPFAQTIRNITLSLMSQHTTSQAVKNTAAQVFASLHFCAPKDAAAAEWNQTVLQVIEATHQASDQIFRSVIEEWSAIQHRPSSVSRNKKTTHEVRANDSDAIGMDKWVGMQEGCHRIISLLQLLCALLCNPHAQSVSIPITQTIDLGLRLAAVLVPTKSYALRDNKEIGREEREELFLNLPRIHCALLEMHTRVAAVFGTAISPAHQPVLSQIWNIFEAESFDGGIRADTYRGLREMLRCHCSLLHSRDVDYINSVIRKCCIDIKLAYECEDISSTKSKDTKTTTLNLELHHTSKQAATINMIQTDILDAAWNLLPCLLTYVPNSLLASSMRAEIERTAILVGHEEALLASIMNPPLPRRNGLSAPSMLPFLAQANKGGMATEALLRPRMPVIRPTQESDPDEIMEDKEGDMGPVSAQSVDTSWTDAAVFVAEDRENDVTNSSDEVQPNKKREHAVIEDTTVPTLSDTVKRARTKPQSLNHHLEVETPDHNRATGKLDTITSFEVASLGSGNHDIVPAVTLREDTISAAAVAADTPLNTVDTEINDDSDESEIPQIDVELSSDEEDDNEEEL